MHAWRDGWMDGWMDGCKATSKDQGGGGAPQTPRAWRIFGSLYDATHILLSMHDTEGISPRNFPKRMRLLGHRAQHAPRRSSALLATASSVPAGFECISTRVRL